MSMNRSGRLRGMGGVACMLGFVAMTGPVWAQTPTTTAKRGVTNQNVYTPSSTQPLAVAVYGNPYTNPYMNPFATQGQMSRTDMALYFYAAQQATMGMNASKVGPARAGDRVGSPVPGRDVSTSVSSQVPGGNAMSYFQRGATANRQTGRYYQRQNAHFLSNGH